MVKNNSVNENQMENRYQKRVDRYKQLLEATKKPISKLIILKLSSIVLMIISLVSAYETGGYIYGISCFVLLCGVYIVLGQKHKLIINYRSDIEELMAINQKGIKRFNGEWRSFKDNGSEFIVSGHAYATDLDIIGKDSLYQWLNMCETPWGKKDLAKSLLYQNFSNDEIKSRQEAILELSKKVNFRHRLNLETKKLKGSQKQVNALANWGKIVEPLYQKKWFILLIKVLPLLTLLAIVFGPLMHKVSNNYAIVFLLCQIALLYKGRKHRASYLDSVYQSNKSIQKLKGVFKVLEKHKHKSKLLEELRLQLFNNTKELPSKQIVGLSKIASNISNRKSSVYFIINILLLWDYQCCVSLEKWKERYGGNLENWFEIIGKFESLSSIALMGHDHPDWIVPDVLDESATTDIKAEGVGHPLVGSACVTNSIIFDKETPIVLITGSNMSGKSTFLRTIGINLVIAYSGGAVFAQSFSCQQMNLYSCMRVSDDLQNNISSFYGEILRIKMIIEKVKENQKVFFLLDEIFKGTNSIDRHIAAKAVIHNLNKYGAVGMVSTHDLELDVIEEESHGAVKNHHFEEGYKEGQITFDYTLKNGVSTTRNAIYLIKAAGIDM